MPIVYGSDHFDVTVANSAGGPNVPLPTGTRITRYCKQGGNNSLAGDSWANAWADPHAACAKASTTQPMDIYVLDGSVFSYSAGSKTWPASPANNCHQLIGQKLDGTPGRFTMTGGYTQLTANSPGTGGWRVVNAIWDTISTDYAVKPFSTNGIEFNCCEFTRVSASGAAGSAGGAQGVLSESCTRVFFFACVFAFAGNHWGDHPAYHGFYNNGGSGGGSSKLWHVNCLFHDNNFGFDYQGYGAQDDSGLINCTLYNSFSGTTIGGTADATRGKAIRVVRANNIIVNHDGTSNPFADGQGGWAAHDFYSGGPPGSTNHRWINNLTNNNNGGNTDFNGATYLATTPNYTGDPLFVTTSDPRDRVATTSWTKTNGVRTGTATYSTGVRNHRIQSTSPARSRGAWLGVKVDFDGNPRPTGAAATPDIGAHQFAATMPSPVTTVAAPTALVGKGFDGALQVEWQSGIASPGNTTNVSSTLTSLGSAAFPIALASWAADTQDRQYVVERTGKIWVWKNGIKQGTPFLDVSSIVAPDGTGLGNEGGALSIAFHPAFGTGTNYRFYLGMVQKSNNTLYISEFQSSSVNVDVANPASRRDLVSIASSDNLGRHYGGCIRFGPDGAMYYTVGDMTQNTGGANAPQDNSNPRGKLHKITDPTVATPTPILVANGLRNPWKWDFDPGAPYIAGTLCPQDIYVGHVGEATYEAIWRIPGGSTSVRNAGWPNYEGNVGPRSGFSAITFDPAIIVQTHTNGFFSITGGTVVRDKYVTDQLKGKYIYTDYLKTGLRRADAVTGANDAAAGTLAGTSVASMDRDQFNRSYLLEQTSTGRVLRLSGAAQTPPQTGFSRYRVYINGVEQTLVDPTSFVYNKGGLTNGSTYTVEVLAEDASGGQSTKTAVQVIPGTTEIPSSTQNLALNKVATSSGNEDALLIPANAVDGIATTRWSSAKLQTTLQWIQVDLGSLQTIASVKINWEAYSSAYNVQTSTDGVTFTTRVAGTASAAGYATHTLPTAVSARYVRIADQQLNPVNTNTSIWELEVYGAAAPTVSDTLAPPQPSNLTLTAQSGGWTATHDDNSKAASDFLKYVWFENGVQLAGPADPKSATYSVTNRTNGIVYTIGVEAWDDKTPPNISSRTLASVTPTAPSASYVGVAGSKSSSTAITDWTIALNGTVTDATFLLIAHCYSPNSATFAPAGWATVPGVANPMSTGTERIQVLYRQGAVGLTSVDFNESAATRGAIIVYTIKMNNFTDPFGTISVKSLSDAVTTRDLVVPAITPDANDSLLLYLGEINHGSAMGPPPDITELTDIHVTES